MKKCQLVYNIVNVFTGALHQCRCMITNYLWCSCKSLTVRMGHSQFLNGFHRSTLWHMSLDHVIAYLPFCAIIQKVYKCQIGVDHAISNPVAAQSLVDLK